MEKLVIGITGGIATGKSNVTKELREKGYYVIDADVISREALDLNEPCYHKVCEAFGEKYLNLDYTINRQKLGGLIFNDKEAKIKLESIIHPHVYNKIIEKLRQTNNKVVFLDIPLLFESEFDKICDKIVCVSVPYKVQLDRLIARDGLSFPLAINKIASQMELKEKRKRSDYVIDSSGSFSETKIKIEEMLGDMLNG